MAVAASNQAILLRDGQWLRRTSRIFKTPGKHYWRLWLGDLPTAPGDTATTPEDTATEAPGGFYSLFFTEATVFDSTIHIFPSTP